MIPQINRFVDDPIKNGVQVPRCFYANDDVGVLIMEDLRLKGYTVQDKAVGYDMPHLQVVLEQLANLHALSYHWIETYPGGLKRFQKDFWPMNGSAWIPMETPEMVAVTEGLFECVYDINMSIVEEHCKVNQ